jgi:hypothetical protein
VHNELLRMCILAPVLRPWKRNCQIFICCQISCCFQAIEHVGTLREQIFQLNRHSIITMLQVNLAKIWDMVALLYASGLCLQLQCYSAIRGNLIHNPNAPFSIATLHIEKIISALFERSGLLIRPFPVVFVHCKRPLLPSALLFHGV